MLIHSEADTKCITYLNTWRQPRPPPPPLQPQHLLIKLIMLLNSSGASFCAIKAGKKKKLNNISKFSD